MASKAKTNSYISQWYSHDRRHRHRSGHTKIPIFSSILVRSITPIAAIVTRRSITDLSGSSLGGPAIAHVYDPLSVIRIMDQNKRTIQEQLFFYLMPILIIQRWSIIENPAIPLYTLKETKAILKALNRTGDFLIPTPHEAPAFVREMIGLEPHDVIKVGEIEVEIVPVDHDAYGAAALLIRNTGSLYCLYWRFLRGCLAIIQSGQKNLSVSQTHGSIDDGRSQYQFS